MSKRQIRLYFPALDGQEALLFRRLSGDEGLSRLFQYEVELVSRSPSIDMDKVLGQDMGIGLELTPDAERYFHGYVASFAQIDFDGEFAVYRAILRPHLWRLTRTADCRIFQKTRVPDIVAQILSEHGISPVKTHYDGGNRGPYLPWDYCVQYRETDFNFISRLLEHEGIHYFFKHEKDKHTLVLTDSLAGHARVPGYESVEYRRATSGGAHAVEGIWSWQTTRTVLPGTYAARDYDFMNPTTPVHRTSSGTVERKHAKSVTPEYELYDHPETVVQLEGYSPQDLEDYARIRMEEVHTQYEVIRAKANARGLGPGNLFKVTSGFSDDLENNEYLVTSADLLLHMNQGGSGGGDESETIYDCTLQAMKSTHGYRPPRTAAKPVIQGPQSATVVGQDGEKVHTDKHGRVKVQFHWDREGKSNEDSSCWVRVSQSWAGANWGGMFLPHIGQEVLVGFLEGDPDRPIVIGRVYNPRNMPPLALPDNKFKSIIRDHFGNEIVMDGTPGEEHMSLYSPSHHSVLKIGKSVKALTFSDAGSSSYDSKAFSFGSKTSYTKGHTWSWDRGMWFSAKLGIGVSATIGAEATVSAATKLSFVGGGTVTLSASWSCAWGYARELRFTRGTYTRSSSNDILLDSHKSVFITGGEGDHTLIEAGKDKLILSFDEAVSDTRATAMKEAGTKAKIYAGLATGVIAVISSAGVLGYERDIDDMGPVKEKDPDGKGQKPFNAFYNLAQTKAMEDAHDKISGICVEDGAALAASAVGVTSGIKDFLGQGIDPPKHNKPSSRIVLSKNLIVSSAGKAKKTRSIMSETTGFSFRTDKLIVLDAEEEILCISKKDLTLSSKTKLKIEGHLKHKNITVLP